MSRVAVIGCGIFGAVIALKLQSEGHAVTVFERLDRPLAGASRNNQNRLHLGFHYPRDAETARQCIKGFRAFKQAFPGSIVDGFPNAYFVAGAGSHTTPEEYLTFCDALDLEYTTIDPAQYSPPVHDVALGLLTDEVVYDCESLAALVSQQLADSAIQIEYSTEVTGISERGRELVLSLAGTRTESFDFVINATYAGISRLAGCLGLPLTRRQYEYTVVPIIETPFPRTGITVMDGSFMTVLPFGAGPSHLLYHVEHTVVARSTGLHVDASWMDPSTSPFSRLDARALFQRIRDAACRFVPALAQSRLAGFLHGPRMVLAGTDSTDARPSIIDQPRSNYLDVFSGKIDHCMWVADDVAARLGDRRDGVRELAGCASRSPA